MSIHIKDRLLLSAFSGGIAAVIANLSLYAVNIFLPGYNINMPEVTAEFFLNIDPNRIDILTRALGFVWSMIVGGVYSLIYIIALDLTGWKNLMIKALIIVTGGWLIGVGMVMKWLGIGEYIRGEPQSIAAFFGAHLVFAMILGLLVKRFEGGRREEITASVRKED